jgi:thiosulfate/3-mercaptopyruvate sulfurtransferase
MILSPALIETDSLATWEMNDFRVVETGMTRQEFDAGHIPGSVFWSLSDLLTPDFRLKTDAAQFGKLLSRSGITPDTFVVCSFGHQSTAGSAAWLLWVVTGFGHNKTLVLNGGTPKWRAEGRPLTDLTCELKQTSYSCPPPFDESQRACLIRVREAVRRNATKVDNQTKPDAVTLLDGRTPEEFNGEHFFNAPPQPGEKAGHIPGARHLPHTSLFQSDGVYEPVGELQALCADFGLQSDHEAITYCTVGMRSAALWFALKHLLNFPHVRNYDGSWKEWSQSGAVSSPNQDRDHDYAKA